MSSSRAIVLGGSIAGLCAAGAVAGHFDEVVVLERDTLPPDADHRKGVPQSKHPHFLLNSGRRALGELFPGYEDALVEAGGLYLMPSMVAAHCESNGWVPRRASSMTMVFGSRILIERVLRDKVRELPNVSITEGVSVRGLATIGGGTSDGRVTGVWIGDPDARDGQRLIEGDLIIDAMGRGSSVSTWLREAGWPQVELKSLDANVTYTSRWYQKPTGADAPAEWWWKQMSIMPTTDTGIHPDEHEYLCQFFPIEGDRAIVTMGSWGLDMPRKSDDFVAAANRTRAPAFGKAIAHCEPLSEVHLTRSTGNKWYRYDLLPNPPVGLVTIGDSICAFNPLYAQGMSSAGRSAVLLRQMLCEKPTLDRQFFREFLDRQRESLNVPWTLALARDQGYEHATGSELPPRWKQRIVGRLSWPIFNLISAASREDAVVERLFTGLFNLDDAFNDVTRNPRFLFGLARFALKRALRRNALPLGFDAGQDPPSRDYSDSGAAVPVAGSTREKQSA